MDYKFFDDENYSVALQQLFFGNEPEIAAMNHAFDSAYLFSNENLAELFSNMDVKDKSVATVGSSGDQLLNLLYYGAKDVTVVDRSLFFEQFIELKMAAIKNFSYEEFLDFMFKERYTDAKFYSKLSHSLNKKSQVFWDIIFSNDADGMRNTIYKIFQHFSFNKAGSTGSEFYCSEEAFNRLKDILKNDDYKISYITSDFVDFPERLEKNKYDLVMLSNIVDHFSNSNSSYFTKILKEIETKNLKDYGKIQILTFFNAETLNAFLKNFASESFDKSNMEIISIHRVNESRSEYFDNHNKRSEIMSEINGVMIEKQPH